MRTERTIQAALVGDAGGDDRAYDWTTGEPLEGFCVGCGHGACKFAKIPHAKQPLSALDSACRGAKNCSECRRERREREEQIAHYVQRRMGH